MSSLHAAARKYHVDVYDLLEHLYSLETELKTLQNMHNDIARLTKLYQEQTQKYEAAALLLRKSRQQYATQLAEEISSCIRQLGMPHGYVTIALTPLDKMQAHGQDKVEYLVCTNPGTTPDTLNKIASGGELSRISLAIQLITAERGATPTMLFDEVDVGIGGATAALVGKMLRTLGERLQVFCVTHQPQVASNAHNHFVVAKQSDGKHTYSSITPLENDDKVSEIARMLGGLNITEQSRAHARELLLAVE